jgi:hypothetical protein
MSFLSCVPTLALDTYVGFNNSVLKVSPQR